MLKESLPSELKLKDVTLLDSSRQSFPGVVAYKEWTSRESFKRGFKRSAKIVGVITVLPLPLAVIEPFAFMVWGGILITFVILVVGPYLHLKYWGEKWTFFYVKGECPQCHQIGELTPYLSTAMAQEFTVLCPACGQTALVLVLD